MFRAQQNEFDNAVAKATDENLTSENWEFIMDVCDRANASDSGARDVVAALIKRLAHRNANVQLYTLEVGGFCLCLSSARSLCSLAHADSMCVACQCSLPELRHQGAYRTCFAELY